MEKMFEIKDYVNKEEKTENTIGITTKSKKADNNWIKPQGPNVEAAHYRSIELRKIQKKIVRLLDDTDTANISKSLTDEYNLMMNSLSMVIALEHNAILMGDVIDV